MSREGPWPIAGKHVKLMRSGDEYALTVGKTVLPHLRLSHLALIATFCKELSRPDYDDDDPEPQDLAELVAYICSAEVERVASVNPLTAPELSRLPHAADGV